MSQYSQENTVFEEKENEKQGRSKSLVMSLPKVISPNHSKQTISPTPLLDIFSAFLMFLKILRGLSENTFT